MFRIKTADFQLDKLAGLRISFCPDAGFQFKNESVLDIDPVYKTVIFRKISNNLLTIIAGIVCQFLLQSRAKLVEFRHTQGCFCIATTVKNSVKLVQAVIFKTDDHLNDLDSEEAQFR